MSTGLFNRGKYDILRANINLTSDTIKIGLMATGYPAAFNPDTHQFWSDVSANEIAATGGYTAGGATLANKAFTQDNANDLAYFDADDPQWTTATFTAYGAIVYKSTGTASTSPLIGWWDFGGAKTGTGGTFIAAIDPTGLIAEA